MPGWRQFETAFAVVLIALAIAVTAPTAKGSDTASVAELQKRIPEDCLEGKQRTTPSDGKLRLLTGPGPGNSKVSPGYYYKVGKSIAQELPVESIATSKTECNLWGL